MAAGIKARIQSLDSEVKVYAASPSPESVQDLIAFDLRINALAREILESPPINGKSQKRLEALMKTRAYLISHRSPSHDQPTLFLNMIQPLFPAPLCHAYSEIAVPTISTYHFINRRIAAMKCDPSALAHVPSAVLEKLGDLSEKEIDLFWVAIDGRPCQWIVDPDRADNLFNLSPHTWVYPHARLGDDSESQINMGIFPEFGVERSSGDKAIAFNRTGPMRIHIHLRSEEGIMLYSPDNAQFRITQGSPLAIFWSVAEKDSRVALSKMVVLRNYEHPIVSSLVNSIGYTNTLSAYLNCLEELSKTAFQETFGELISQLNIEAPEAEAAFKNLPLSFQYGILKEAWKLKGCPPPSVHPDFGRAAFHRDPSLSQGLHLSAPERAQAAANFMHLLKSQLVDSQVALLEKSQTLAKSEGAFKMMQCADLFLKGEIENAWELFSSLTQREKQTVYYSAWVLCGCPHLEKFGESIFHTPETVPDHRAFLRFWYFNEPWNKNADEISFLCTPLLNLSKEFRAQALLFAASKPTHLSIEQPALPMHTSALTDLYDPFQTLLASAEFATLPLKEKSACMNALFSLLSKKDRDTIHYRVYRNSPGSKVGENWGALHVADDPDILRGAYAHALQSTPSSSSSQPASSVQTVSLRDMHRPFYTLIASPQLNALSKEARSVCINALLSSLPQQELDAIHYQVYRNSPPGPKTGSNWGALHVGDHLDILRNAYERTMRNPPKPQNIASSSQPSSSQQGIPLFELLEPFDALVSSEEFAAKPPEERSVQMNDFLSCLCKKDIDTIHYQVYKHSPGPKEGENWGARHSAHDLAILRRAFAHAVQNG